MKKSAVVLTTVLFFMTACSVAVPSGTVKDKQYIIILEDKQGNDQRHEVTKKEFESVKVGDTFDTK